MKSHQIKIRNIDLEIYDSDESLSVPLIAKDFENDVYGITQLKFADNDVVLDIGSHVGVFSIYLAKLYPSIKIYAIEAFRPNYEMLIRNIAVNKVYNITSCQHTVYGSSGLEVDLSAREGNTGGACLHKCMQTMGKISLFEKGKTLSFDDLYRNLGLGKIRLVKLDCEGAEYQIFYNSKTLNKNNVAAITLELHDSVHIQSCGYSPDKLYMDLCGEFGINNVLCANEVKNGKIEYANVDLS